MTTDEQVTETDAIPAAVRAVVNALYPNETLEEIPPRGGMSDLRIQTAQHAISAYLAASSECRTPVERSSGANDGE